MQQVLVAENLKFTTQLQEQEKSFMEMYQMLQEKDKESSMEIERRFNLQIIDQSTLHR